MTINPEQTPNIRFDTNHHARLEKLKTACEVLDKYNNDDELHSRAYNTSPLMLEELNEELRNSEEFRDFLDVFGWPDEEDERITPVEQNDPNETDQMFLDRLRPSQDIDDTSNSLNNFMIWLTVEPNKNPKITRPLDVYAAQPALHRAWQIEPEFMRALYEATISLDQKEARIPSREAFDSDAEHGLVIAKAARIAYHLLGRLIKTTDIDLMCRLLHDASSNSQISDAGTELRK